MKFAEFTLTSLAALLLFGTAATPSVAQNWIPIRNSVSGWYWFSPIGRGVRFCCSVYRQSGG